VRIFPRLLLGATAGLVIGTALLLVGLLRAGAARVAGIKVSFDDALPSAAVFLAGFALGGFVTAVLWPPKPSTWRQRLAFIAGMTCVIAGLVSFNHGFPNQWGVREWAITLVLGGVFGSAGYSGWNSY